MIVNESNHVDRHVHTPGEIDGRTSDSDALNIRCGTILSVSRMRVTMSAGLVGVWGGWCVCWCAVCVGVLCVLVCCVCWCAVCVGVLCVLVCCVCWCAVCVGVLRVLVCCVCWCAACVGVLCVLECCVCWSAVCVGVLYINELCDHSPHVGFPCYTLLGYQIQNQQLLHCTDPTHQHFVNMYTRVIQPADWRTKVQQKQVTGSGSQGAGHKERVTGSGSQRWGHRSSDKLQDLP